MKIDFLFVLSTAIIFVDCQKFFDLNDILLPLIKNVRVFQSNFVKPRTFETGYRISQRNNVSRWFNYNILISSYV